MPGKTATENPSTQESGLEGAGRLGKGPLQLQWLVWWNHSAFAWFTIAKAISITVYYKIKLGDIY